MTPLELTKRPVGQTGLAICELGFGGASIEYGTAADGDQRAEEVLEAAWTAGIRHFDTAPHYGLGMSEIRMGRFLARQQRDAFTLSTKVGRLIVGEGDDRRRVFDYTYDGIMRSLDESMRRMGLHRTDILLVHDVALDQTDETGRSHMRDLLDSGWKALDELKSAGTIAAYGLGVNDVETCLAVLTRADLDIILLAGRYTPLDPQADDALIGLCRARKVSLLLGGVFNTGILATGAREGALFQYRPASASMLERTRRIEAICDAYGVPLPAAALQFAKGHPVVSAILVATPEPAQLSDNLANYRFPIPSDFWAALAREGIARRYSVESP